MPILRPMVRRRLPMAMTLVTAMLSATSQTLPMREAYTLSPPMRRRIITSRFIASSFLESGGNSHILRYPENSSFSCYFVCSW